MEIEKEKKDKLAAARRKLNEYKQNRSVMKQSTPAGSSKPADVPLFYKNINAPPTSYNIFNPASVDNNNVVSAANSFFTPNTPVVPSPSATVFTPETVSAPHFMTAEQTNRQTSFNPTFEHNQGHSSIQDPEQQQPTTPILYNVSERQTPTSVAANNWGDQISGQVSLRDSVSVEQTSESNPAYPPAQEDPYVNSYSDNHSVISDTNPFTSTLPALNVSQEEPSLITVFSSTSDGASQPVFFAPPVDEVPHPHSFPVYNPQETPTEFSVKQVGADQPAETSLTSYVEGEYVPSAPPITTDSSVNFSEPPVNTADIAFADVLSRGSVESSENADLEVQQAFADSNLNSSVNMFASSLFGSTSSANSAADDGFNLNNGNKSFEFVAASADVPEQKHFTQIFNPLTVASASIADSQDHELPVFEVIEKSDLLQSSPIQNENMESTQEELNSVAAVKAENTGSAEIDLIAAERGNNKVLFGHLTQEVGVAQMNDRPLLDSCNESEFPESEVKMESSSVSNLEQVVDQSSGVQDDGSSEALQQMKSVQEALELQIEELRRENNYLLNRQTELTFKIEESERLAHEFKLEKDRVKEESLTTSQALRARINSLCEENQRIVKNSTDIGVDLREKLEEKSRLLEEMQKAAIILSQSKMDFASRLDHEGERVKDLQKLVREKEEELSKLRSSNAELQEKLKQEQQKDAIIQQLQDQARHYQVQSETLQRELEFLRKKQLKITQSPPTFSEQGNIATFHCSGHGLSDDSQENFSQNQDLEHGVISTQSPSEPSASTAELSNEHDNCEKTSYSEADPHHHGHLSHSSAVGDHHHHEHHEHGNHSHSQEVGDHHHHDHGHGSHSHEESDHHHHDHGDSGHHHSHEHNHDHEHTDGESLPVVVRRGPSDEITELKKTLHRLQWENSTFRDELDVLAVDAKQKRTYEEKCRSLEEENERLRKEVSQLEHVIIQLQGENDTIGDYVTLYQSQKLALKECAKEKDLELEQLALEREMLLHRLSELTALVQELRDSKSEAGSQCADDHVHSPMELAPPEAGTRSKRQIEGKIRELLTEISGSTLIENFHPCAVCSGRLMTV